MAMKWFRKHNKKVLVIGGALLMLAFLMPQQRGCGRRGGRNDYQVGQALGEKIMARQVAWANVELQLLNLIGVTVPAADPIDYLLLLREARKMRIPAGEKAVTDDLAGLVAKKNQASNLAELAGRLASERERLGFVVSEELLRKALGNFVCIKQAQDLVLSRPELIPQEDEQVRRDFSSTLGLAQPSQKQLELAFRNLREKLDVEYVSFPAWQYGSQVATPSEAEIVAQFNAYKDEYPGTKENDLGFGYKQRILLKIEYIRVDLEKVQDGLEQPSPTALREYYDRHKERYLLASENLDSTEDTPAKQYKSFEQVYEDVQADWLRDRAHTKTLSMIGQARGLARTRWGQLKEQQDKVIDLSALYPYGGNHKQSLVSMLSEEFEVKPEYRQSDWMAPEQLETLPGIGASYTHTRPMHGFSRLALSVRQASLEQDNSQDSTFLEVGQDSPVNLVDAQGNMYLFRVIGLRRDESLTAKEMLSNEKLRRKVTSDTVGRGAYQDALARSHGLFVLAEQKGLKKALAEFKDDNLIVRQAGTIARNDWQKALSELQIPLIDSLGRTHGEVVLGWQNLGVSPQLDQPIGILIVQISNKTKAGRITAVGLNLPAGLRLACPQVFTAEGSAGNAGPAVPAGVEGYTLKYYGRSIDGGPTGKFDLLISAEGQELTSRENLSKAGIEPQESQMFLLQLPHPGLRLSAASFARSLGLWPEDITGQGSAVVARLETGSKNVLLRGIFPANRRRELLQECFSVLKRPDLQRNPAEDAKDDTQDPEQQDSAGAWELLETGLSQEPPCAIVEVPGEKVCYVISVKKHLPLSLAEFRQNRSALSNRLTAEQHTMLANQWWNHTNIRKRTGYKEIQGEEADQAPAKENTQPSTEE